MGAGLLQARVDLVPIEPFGCLSAIVAGEQVHGGWAGVRLHHGVLVHRRRIIILVISADVLQATVVDADGEGVDLAR